MTREYGGRRPTPTAANVLPTGISRAKPPAWPFDGPTVDEQALWRDLWRRPVAHLWRSQHIAPMVVARYVRVLVRNPASGSLAQMESALGLTPASLTRLRVQFEAPSPPLSAEAEARIAAARRRLEAVR